MPISPISDPVKSVWSYQANDAMLCTAITSDGQYVAAGSKNGHLYFFARSNKLLWERQVDRDTFCLALAENRRYLLVGCASSSNARIWKASLWSYEGDLIHTFEVDGAILSVGITPDADLIALSTLRQSLYLFAGDGNKLWQKRIDGPARHLSLTPDGQFIAVGSDDQQVYLFDQSGRECWKYKTEAPVFTGARTDATATYIIAGSNDHGVYLLDREGQCRWRYNTENNLNVVAITPDGRYMAAAGNAHKIFCFERSGTLCWEYQASADIYALDISHDGQFVVAGTDNYQVYLLDSEGRCIWRQKTRDRVCSVAITPNGRLFVAASLDHSLALYENLAASDDFSPHWAMRLIAQRLRPMYAQNPYQGIASWFDEFDRVLGQRAFALCEALLREIREQGYILKVREAEYVESREAALLLCQGISFHQRQEYEAARQCYMRSGEIQQRINHRAGEGQIQVALEELAKLQNSDPAVLRILLSKPHVMGNGSKIVAARLAEELSLAERQRMIIAAKEEGYFSLLAQELLSGKWETQTNAALALSWLKPGPDYDMLINMLTSSNWMVRWQAALILQDKFTENQGTFSLYRDKVRQAVALCLEQEENDPMVRRATAELLGKIGDASATSRLETLLQDQDVEVRFAAIEALTQVGTRQVLPTLHVVQDGQEMHGSSIKDKAREAIEQIENRYPIFEVKAVTFCRELQGQNQPVRTGTIFLAAAWTMYCVATISLAQPGQRVTCVWREKGRIVSEEEQTLPDQPSLSSTPLIELLDNKEASQSSSAGQAAQPHLQDIIFSWTPKKEKWSTGKYSVSVRLESEEPREASFVIIDQITIASAQTCADLEGNGRYLLPLQVFPETIPYIYCKVSLGEAPIDAEVEGKVYHVNTNTRIEEATIRAKVTGEGRNAQVILKYAADKWEAGEYSIVLETSTKSRKNCNFEILQPKDIFREL
jgi:HEAT repeat protein